MMRTKIARSEPWEQEEGWEKIVCEAVTKFPMAPRDARKILELAGILFAYGVPEEHIFRSLQGRSLAREREVISRAAFVDEANKRLSKRHKR